MGGCAGRAESGVGTARSSSRPEECVLSEEGMTVLLRELRLRQFGLNFALHCHVLWCTNTRYQTQGLLHCCRFAADYPLILDLPCFRMALEVGRAMQAA